MSWSQDAEDHFSNWICTLPKPVAQAVMLMIIFAELAFMIIFWDEIGYFAEIMLRLVS